MTLLSDPWQKEMNTAWWTYLGEAAVFWKWSLVQMGGPGYTETVT